MILISFKYNKLKFFYDYNSIILFFSIFKILNFKNFFIKFKNNLYFIFLISVKNLFFINFLHFFINILFFNLNLLIPLIIKDEHNMSLIVLSYVL